MYVMYCTQIIITCFTYFKSSCIYKSIIISLLQASNFLKYILSSYKYTLSKFNTSIRIIKFKKLLRLLN